MDDMWNEWGCKLAIDANSDCSKRKMNKITHSSKLELQSFGQRIAKDLEGKYYLSRVCICGSDANLHALFTITGGNTDLCLIAAGSYVAGDAGTMQSMSTSTYIAPMGPAGITDPSAVKCNFTKTHTVALPYSIPGVMEMDDLTVYEDQCLQRLHLMCLQARMKGRAYKCIMLELMLAGNGACLSDRALLMLGVIAKRHDFKFLVDEIMTGGRTGTMLMLDTKPKVFRDQVSLVTMGKWLQAGIVLETKNFYESSSGMFIGLLQHTDTRGLSIVGNIPMIQQNWDKVFSNLNSADCRRELVLKKFNNIKAEETWGKGCIIFAPISRTENVKGLKCRLLPLLDVCTPLEKSVKYKVAVEWSKSKINKLVVGGVMKWLPNIPFFDYLVVGPADKNNKCITETNYFKFVTHLSGLRAGDVIELKDLSKKVFLGALNYVEVGSLLRTAASQNLVTYKVIGNNRVRRWIVNEICIHKFFVMQESAPVQHQPYNSPFLNDKNRKRQYVSI